MVLIVSFVIGVLILLILQFIITRLSRSKASKTLEEILKKTDRPGNNIDYLDDKHLSITNIREPATVYRFAIVAPYRLRSPGVVNRVLPIAMGLAEDGHIVRIYLPGASASRGVEVTYLGLVQIYRLQAVSPRGRPRKLLTFLRLFSHIMDFHPDHFYGFKPRGYVALLGIILYTLRKIPYIRKRWELHRIWIDSDNWEGFGGWADRDPHPFHEKLLIDQMEKMAFRCCDKVFAASQELRLKRIFPVRKNLESIEYLKNHLSLDFWPEHKIPPSPPAELEKQLKKFGKPDVLLVYTRFLEFTAERLIKIFSEVLKSVPNTVLLIVGTSLDYTSALERLKLRSQIGSAGIDSSRIIETGWVPYLSLRSYWSVSKIAIFPYDDTILNRSRSPVKILELMAAGKAVIADAVGEVKEIISHGVNGLLIPDNNDKIFSDTIIDLLGQPKLQHELGYAANDKVHKDYGWNKGIELLEKELEKEAKQEDNSKDHKNNSSGQTDTKSNKS